MTVGSLVEYVQKGKTDKLKLHNLVGAVNDLIAVSSAVAEQGAKRLSSGSVKSISELIDTLVGLDKNNLKIIAKLGAIGVIVTSINTLNEMDENDTDGKIAVGTKNALVVALLLTTGWPAVLGLIAVELAWLLVEDSFVDSPMEVYLRKNLFFNNRHENASLGGSLSTFWTLATNQPIDRAYLAPILLDTLHSTSNTYNYFGERKGSELKGFLSHKDMRKFIAENYEVNPLAFETAMRNELSTLKQVLYGLKISPDEDGVPVCKYKAYKANVYYLTGIKLPDDLMKTNEEILIQKADEYHHVDKKTSVVANSGYSTYDLLEHIESRNRQALLDFIDTDKRSVIIVNSDIILNYDVAYEEDTSFAGASSLWAQNGRVIKIKKLNQVTLTTRDYNYIKSLKTKEKTDV